MANVPYGSMMSLITDDPVQRSQLSTFRSAGSMIANLVTGSLLPVLIYDASNTLLGERVFWIALIMGGIGLLFFQFMIRTTVIRVDTEVKTGEEMPKFNVVKAMGAFIRNRAAVGASLAGMSGFIGMYGAQTAVTVMFQSYFKNARISGVVGMLSMFGVFIFMPFATTITKKIGKKEGCTIGAVVACLAYVLMFALPITPDGKGMALYVLCQVIAMIGNGYSSCVTWALIADAIDYEEWKLGTRNEGTTYALYSFFRKVAQGLGPSLGLVARHRGWLQRHPWPRPARADRDQPALPRARHVPRRHRAGAGRLRPHLQRRPQDAESDERRPRSPSRCQVSNAKRHTRRRRCAVLPTKGQDRKVLAFCLLWVALPVFELGVNFGDVVVVEPFVQRQLKGVGGGRALPAGVVAHQRGGAHHHVGRHK